MLAFRSANCRCSLELTPRCSLELTREAVPGQPGHARLEREHRREALRIAAGFKGDDAFEAGVSEEQALDTVLPWLSDERLMELAGEAVELYCWDRLGCDN